jgi:hypothetical protein
MSGLLPHKRLEWLAFTNDLYGIASGRIDYADSIDRLLHKWGRFAGSIIEDVSRFDFACGGIDDIRNLMRDYQQERGLAMKVKGVDDIRAYIDQWDRERFSP